MNNKIKIQTFGKPLFSIHSDDRYPDFVKVKFLIRPEIAD